MSEKIKRRVEAMEKQTGQSEQGILAVIRHDDGTVTTMEGQPVEPRDLMGPLPVLIVCSVPWDSTQLRRLTDDEMEAKHPGRRARLAQWDGGGDDAA